MKSDYLDHFKVQVKVFGIYVGKERIKGSLMSHNYNQVSPNYWKVVLRILKRRLSNTIISYQKIQILLLTIFCTWKILLRVNKTFAYDKL